MLLTRLHLQFWLLFFNTQLKKHKMSLLTFKANKVVRHILYYYTGFCQIQLPVRANRKRSLENIKNRCSLLF